MMFPCVARIWTVLMCRLRVVPVWSERTATSMPRAGLFKFRQQSLHRLDHRDDVCAWLPLNIEDDGGGPVGPAGELRVLRPLDDGRDVRKPDRGTVLLGHDQTLVVLGRLELIVVVDR